MDRGLVLFHNFTQDELDPLLKALREAELPRQPLKSSTPSPLGLISGLTTTKRTSPPPPNRTIGTFSQP